MRILYKCIIFTGIFLCLGALSAYAAPANIDSLLIGVPVYPLALDPAVITDEFSPQVAANIYETLVDRDPNTGQIIPKLASQWYSNSNYTAWYFILRKGVYFTDGAPFDAKAAAFSFARQMDTRNIYHTPRYGYFSYYAALLNGFPGEVLAVRAPEPYRLEIIFNKPVPDFLEIISLPQFSIVSPKAVKLYKDDFYKNPVGTGPYKVASWDYASRMVLEKNNAYWGKRPMANKIILQFISSHDHRFSLLKKGYLDIMLGSEIKDMPDVEKTGRYKSAQYPYAFDVLLGINCNRYPFSNYNLRHAVKCALAQDLLDSVHAFEPAGAGSNYRAQFQQNKKNSVNFNKAQKLLRGEGYAGKQIIECIVPDSVPLYAYKTDSIAGKIKFLLAECGFAGIRVSELPPSKFNERITRGEYDLALFYTDLKNKNEELFYLTYFNQSCPPKYNLNKFHLYTRTLKGILQNIYDNYDDSYVLGEIESYVQYEMPYVFLSRLQYKIIYPERIKGLRFDGNGCLRFDKVYEEK